MSGSIIYPVENLNFMRKYEKIMLHNPIGRGIEVIPQYQIIDICWGRFILGLPHYEVFKRLNQ